jgi:hypothetical protein
MAERGLARAPGGTSLCRGRVAPEGGDGDGPVDLIHALRAFVDAASIDTAWIESACIAKKQRKRASNACFGCIHTIRAEHLNDCDCDSDCNDDCVRIAAPTFASLRMRCDGERAAAMCERSGASQRAECSDRSPTCAISKMHATTPGLNGWRLGCNSTLAAFALGCAPTACRMHRVRLGHLTDRDWRGTISQRFTVHHF